MSGQAAELKQAVDAAKRGSPDAISILIARYRADILAYCRSISRDSALAEDLCQEVCLRIFLHVDSLDDPARYRGWLRKVAINVLRDWKRCRSASEALCQPTFLLESQLSSACSPEDRVELIGVLSRLSPLELTLLLGADLEGRSYQEIATHTQQSVAGIRNRLGRLRHRLRKKENVSYSKGETS